MHGAGVIEAIEEREVLGNRQTYYVMKLPIGEMQVMVPTKSEKGTGLRTVATESDLREVFRVLSARKTAMSANWNRRYRANLEKIKSGNILDVAEVVRNLALRDNEKGLSTGERKMLESARQILLSELILALDLKVEEANTMLEEVLAL
jgi:CarD family transcriptional regulator